MIENKKILITGGLGFIFSHVAEYFAKNNEVWIIDALLDGSCLSLAKKWINEPKHNITPIIKDIKDIGELHTCKNSLSFNLMNELGITQKTLNDINVPKEFDYIIHAAAESNVDKSIADGSLFLTTNVLGTYAVLEYAKTFQPALKGFLYVSTDEIYGSTTLPSFASTTLLAPSNPYSASKAAGGHLCWSYYKTHNVPVQEVRMCNIIGTRQAKTKLLPKVIDCILNNKEFGVYDGGTHVREYMDVRDVCPIIDDVLSSNKREVHNLTYNQMRSINEVIHTVAKIIGIKPKTYEATRKGHDSSYTMHPSAIMVCYESGKKRWKRDHCVMEETVKWMLEELGWKG